MLTRRGLLLAGAVGGAATLSGCSGVGIKLASAFVQPADGLGPVADRLNRALRDRDEAAFTGLFVPALRAKAALVHRNAGVLGSFAFEVESDDGAEALLAKWRMGEERAASTSVLPAERADGEGVRVASFGPPGPRRIPTWWDHPVEVLGTGPVRVMAAQARAEASRAWADSAGEAIGHLAASGLDPWLPEWDGTLSVEVPNDIGGMRPSTDAAATATTERRGDTSRIVVNPTLIERYDAESRAGLLVHEGVHVVTRANWWKVPDWITEGLAESVSTPVWAASATTNARLVKDAVAHGIPDTLPTDEQIQDDETDSTAYALAQVAVEACFERWGRAESLRWLASWPEGAPEVGEITQVYRAALRRR